MEFLDRTIQCFGQSVGLSVIIKSSVVTEAMSAAPFHTSVQKHYPHFCQMFLSCKKAAFALTSVSGFPFV